MPRKRVEGAAAKPTAAEEKSPKHYGAHLNEIVEHFREFDPEGWDEIALTPLQHGVEVMARKLAARG